ncbi:MAG: putative fatty-acid--CoA ligase [Acidimicrobiales bacterium]|jgi:acyl-CoA synthetase (AMP-forming)/AMP-acid ligase II|nr:putative fatty-acid--CoA ligase [Acidimicrobiales bacterium]
MALDPLAVHASTWPDRAAVVVGDEVTTYAAFNADINRLGNGLRALDLRPGDRAVWCGPNSRQVLTFIHAARKIGMVSVPLAYRFTAEEMAYVIDNSDATLVVVDAEEAHKIEQVRDRLTKVREVVVFGDGPADEGFRRWDDVLATGGDGEPELDQTGFGATMIYTSGTTGKPKGALRTASAPGLIVALMQELRLEPGNEVHITTGPLYHSGPLAWASLTHTLGGTVVVMRKFDPELWVDLVTRHRVTNTFTAPTQLKRIVALPPESLARLDLTSMRSLVANAAPVPYALKQEIYAKLGDWFLFEVYGSTELGVDTVMRPEDQLRKPGSCGRPYGGIEILIVGDDGVPVPEGEPGELYVRTPLAMDGYHRTEEQLHAIDLEGGGWKSVGDIARVDDEGFVYICDRAKDMIISGGVNIYPAEIEAVLHEHPDVMDAAVFGIPDEEWGEKVHAVVQPRPGRSIDMAGLEQFASERLAGYKRPRSWEFRDELPRTESGKLLKRLLRDEHWAGRATRV